MQIRELSVAPSLRAAAVITALLSVGMGNPIQMKVTKLPHLRRHGPVVIHQQRDQSSYYSYNWAGYAVTGSTGSVTSVYASWVVPTATCAATPSGYAAFWTGIDGWTSSTVEQIGTDSDCVNLLGTETGVPTYYAWVEFYPQNPFLVGNYSNAGVCLSDCVYPGDKMVASVTVLGAGASTPAPKGSSHSSTEFGVTVVDVTRGWEYSTSAAVPGAKQTSAEWIAETPYGCNTSSGFCQLSDFGTADYGAQYTNVAISSYATVNGKMGPIGSFGNAVQDSTMVGYASPNPIMAQPSALQDNGTSFSVAWKNAGP
jgi:Peptidase A4 family